MNILCIYLNSYLIKVQPGFANLYEPFSKTHSQGYSHLPLALDIGSLAYLSLLKETSFIFLKYLVPTFFIA